MRTVMILAVAFIFSVSAAAVPPLLAQPPAAFSVGVVLPLSGSNAFGDGMRKGCEMAIERLANDASLRRPLVLKFEDDQYNPTRTLSAVRKLLDVDKIEAAITVSTGPTRAVLPAIDARGIPLIAIATNDGFTKQSRFSFSLWLPPEIEAGAMVSESLRRGYRRIARVSVQNPVFEQLNRLFAAAIEGKVRIVIDENVTPDETNFRSVLSLIKSLPDIDAIAVNLLPAAAGSFARQARDLGLRQDLFSAEVFESPEAIALSGGALEGQWYSTYADPRGDFMREFRRRYPGTMIIGAANCYDAVQLIAAGLRTGEGGAAVLSYLSSVKNFEGALGTLSVRTDRTFQMPAAIKAVKGNGYEQIRLHEGGE